jgi:hypothetical protein
MAAPRRHHQRHHHHPADPVRPDGHDGQQPGCGGRRIPGQATLTSLTKTSTSWVGLVNSAVEDDVTLQVTSRDYPDQTRTVVLHVTPTPLPSMWWWTA